MYLVYDTTGSILLKSSTQTSFSDFLCAVSTVNYFMELTILLYGCCHSGLLNDRCSMPSIIVKMVENSTTIPIINIHNCQCIPNTKYKFTMFRI
jgi:hypothetical protein